MTEGPMSRTFFRPVESGKKKAETVDTELGLVLRFDECVCERETLAKVLAFRAPRSAEKCPVKSERYEAERGND